MNKKTIFVSLVLFVFTSFSLYSQSAQTIGIVDISARDGISEGEASFVTDFVYNSIYSFVGSDYNIIARSVRDQVLAEHEFALSGFCSDTSCALEIGKMLASDFMIFGTTGKFGTYYRISLQMVDVNTSVIVGSTNQRSETLDDLEIAIDTAVAELFGIESESNAALEPVTTPQYIYPKRGLGITSVSAGVLCVAGGFVTMYLSSNYSTDAGVFLDQYNSNDPYTDFDQAWANYETAYFNASLYEYSSYGLWAGGALFLGVGTYMIFNKAEVGNSSMDLSVVPGIQGMLIKVNLRY